jgi:multidrug efflux pump subunit AcrA (membrane-fusion protein)
MTATIGKVLFVVGMGVAMLFLGACGRDGVATPGAGKAPKAPVVNVITLREEPLVQWLALTGTVVATNAVQISATIEGPIAYCPWREGDAVKEGEKLLEIDRPIYRREVAAAQAALAVARAKLADLKAGAREEEIAQANAMVTQLEENSVFAKSDLGRIEQMVASGSLPGEARDKARVAYVKSTTDLSAAKERLLMLQRGPTATALAVQDALVEEAAARLARAEATAAECVITAPFSGVVTQVHIRPGDLATAKAPLLDMMAPSSQVVRFSIPESYAQLLQPGAACRLRFDALPGERFDSRLTMLYPELDRVTRSRLAEAAIPAKAAVVPGMFVRVDIAAREMPVALTVPDRALLSQPNGGMLVYVVSDGVAKRRPVTIALEGDGIVALASGVRVGEQVVVRGHEMLKDGAKVQVAGAGAAGNGGKQPGAAGEGRVKQELAQ